MTDVDTISIPASRGPAPLASAPGRWWRCPRPRLHLSSLPGRRDVGALALLALLLALAAVGGWYWWQHTRPACRRASWRNGRIEADEIDIETKFAGRIAELLVDEGDMVTAGPERRPHGHARSRGIAAAGRGPGPAGAEGDRGGARQRGAAAEPGRCSPGSRWIARTPGAEGLHHPEDLRPATAAAGRRQCRATRRQAADRRPSMRSRRRGTTSSSCGSTSPTTRWSRPRDGRIQYRIANIGEVLPAGGKVFTMLDIGYVYMDIFLPTADAGRIKVGTDARIVLDAYPDIADPRQGTFIATQAQFTPKAVETRSERDKLMFRVRVRIDPELLRGARRRRCAAACPASPMCALDPAVAWPARAAGHGRADERRATAPVGARSKASRSATARRRALDGVTLDIPAGRSGRPDRPGRRRQVVPARPSSPAQSGSRPGACRGARRRHGRRAPSRRGLSAHRLHAAGAGQEPLSRSQRAREHRVLRPAVRAGAAPSARARIAELLDEHRARAVPGPAGQESCRAACGRSSACAAR